MTQPSLRSFVGLGEDPEVLYTRAPELFLVRCCRDGTSAHLTRFREPDDRGDISEGSGRSELPIAGRVSGDGYGGPWLRAIGRFLPRTGKAEAVYVNCGVFYCECTFCGA